VSICSCSHLNAAETFQLEVVWPPSLLLSSCSEWLPPVYLREILIEDGHNVDELTGSRRLRQRHSKTYSPVQVPLFWQCLC
jgi:hypothetical protein